MVNTAISGAFAQANLDNLRLQLEGIRKQAELYQSLGYPKCGSSLGVSQEKFNALTALNALCVPHALLLWSLLTILKCSGIPEPRRPA